MPDPQAFDLFINGDGQEIINIDDDLKVPDSDDYTPEALDRYLSAEVMINRDGDLIRGTVVSRRKDLNGIPVGKEDSNPILDTREYIVDFEDGSKEVYTANLVAENIYSTINDEGHYELKMKEIMDHRKTSAAIDECDGTYKDRHGVERPKMTTKGWELLVEWSYGGQEWIPLADMKASYPVEVAEYVIQADIATQPAFAWWVRHVLKKRDRIIAKVESKHWAKTHKYGIELPRNLKEALAIDEKTGTDHWKKAFEKEMRNVFGAFSFLEDGEDPPPNYKFCDIQLVWDIKLDLTRKCRLVARGDKLEPPKADTFASVVSRDSVRLFFLLAALNDLEVLSCDVQNAYISAPAREQLWTQFGDELGTQYAGRKAIISKALYGLKSSGRAFREYMAQILRDLGFTSSRGDPDMWLRPAKKATGEKVYEYAICYVDDIAFAGNDAKGFMKALGGRVTLKEGSVKEPDQYLGANVKKVTIPESDNPGKVRWAFESMGYTKKAIAEVEAELNKDGKMLASKAKTPLTSDYRPELDSSYELPPKQLNYYQGLIGILRWIAELGRLDILMWVSMMSRYLMSARRGHLEQVLHIYIHVLEASPEVDDGVRRHRTDIQREHFWNTQLEGLLS